MQSGAENPNSHLAETKICHPDQEIDDLKFITCKSLIVSAKNDPIVPNFNIKNLDISNNNIEFWNPIFGGHVGFSSKISLVEFENQFLQMPRMIGNWFLEGQKTI